MKKIIYTFLLPVLTLVACSKGKPAEEVAPIPVAVQQIVTESDTTIRNYVGVLEAEDKVDMAFSLGGELRRLTVKSGEFVRKGQLLAEVDDTRARAMHDAAVATLRQAEDGYARMERVYREGGISEVRWVQMQTDLEKARQTEITTRKNLEDCRMIAPMDGVVDIRNATIGSDIRPLETFASIQDIHTMNVRYTVPEQEIRHVDIGDNIEVSLPALGKKSYRAQIVERSLVANPLGHTYTIRARLNRVENALPGMVAKVRMSTTGQVGVMIPAECVITVYDGIVVWVAEDSVVNRRHVQITDFVKNGVLVTGGLNDGDIVVVNGYQKLYPGAKVTW